MKAVAAFVSLVSLGAHASHLDDNAGVFTNFKYDHVKFKTQTNCQLDTYPEVSRFLLNLIDQEILGWERSSVSGDPYPSCF